MKMMALEGKPLKATPHPLETYELAEDAILRGRATAETKVSAVLALARGGATQLALKRFRDFQLDQLTDNENALALFGRLLKDRANTLPGSQKGIALKESADAYHKAWQLTGGHYSGINAATLYTLAGKTDIGQKIAKQILKTASSATSYDAPEDNYYWKATCAEAYLLLGGTEQARKTLIQAQKRDPENWVAHASTLKQFERVLKYNNENIKWLESFRPPQTCFYTGRIRGIVANSSLAAALTKKINQFLDKTPLSSAHGALAAGADILFAEAVLARGVQLNILLPCQKDVFETYSVAPFGQAWVSRYRECLARANIITEATNDDTLMGETAISLAAQISMGQAIERANALATRAVQVLIQPSNRGLSEQLKQTWLNSSRGFESATLDASDTSLNSHTSAISNLNLAPCDRNLAAMIFADLTGFGQLHDEDVRNVLASILRPLSEVLKTSGAAMTHVDSWGDGIFAVFKDVASATKTAHALQNTMQSIDLTASNLPETLNLRIGAHYGPVTYADDPITGRAGVFGSQVSYAAKIEPVAVPGAILASEAFASALALSPYKEASSHYIGRQTLKSIVQPVRLFSIN